MGQEHLAGRGDPWDHDPGPPAKRRWARLFAQTPNYRGLGTAVLGREGFRWHFGPMFYRGRLRDGEARVLVIGQEGAQDESLAHRSFVGGTGARMQHFLHQIGITRSYLFLNTFVYPIFGQYVSEELRWLAQHPDYPGDTAGSEQGYSQETHDLPYEPPKEHYHDFDRGPGKSFARLFMGGEAGLEWPDFAALGVRPHPSFGYGPLYRGRPAQARVLVLADQESHDDLFTGRALTGEAGQHLQAFLTSIGITKSYLILRTLPVDTSDLEASVIDAIVDHPRVRALYAAIVERVVDRIASSFALVVGPHAQRLAGHALKASLPQVRMRSWRQPGALADWRRALEEIRDIPFEKDVHSPSFQYDGARGQIPRFDLPFGTLRWQGTSGDRAGRGRLEGMSSPDYYRLSLPPWVFELPPAPLSAGEREAVEKAPVRTG